MIDIINNGESGLSVRTKLNQLIENNNGGILFNNTIFVAENGSDVRTGLNPYDFSKPFLTCAAALEVASSGDNIWVFAGDYSGESSLAGKDGVNWYFMQGVNSPSFVVTGPFSFKILGDIGGDIRVNNANANVECSGHVNGNVISTIGRIEVKSCGGYIKADGGELICGNFGTYAECKSGGILRIENANVVSSEPPSIFGVIYVSNPSGNPKCKVTILNSLIESTVENVTLISVTTQDDVDLDIIDSTLIAINAGVNGGTEGIFMNGPVNPQFKNVSIITAQQGSGVAKSINSSSTQSIYLQTPCAATHAIDGNIIEVGSSFIVNENFRA